MFTQNYINAQNAQLLQQQNNYKYADGTSSTPSYYTYGMLQVGYAMRNAKCGDPTGDVKIPYVYFGSGSTPATKNDYKLEAPITSGLSITNSITSVGKVREGEYCAWNSYVAKNTTNDTINIYEIGAFCSQQTGANEYKKALVERTVLTEPIVIAAGEEKIITYKITFNQTLNVEA